MATRAALVDHFAGDAVFVHPSALFVPEPKEVADLLRHREQSDLAETDDGDLVDGEANTGEETETAPGDLDGDASRADHGLTA